jgi:hypothetical protein
MGVGIFTIALPYFASVAAATGTEGHNNLYVPVAGPWMDLAARPSCGPRSMPCTDSEDLTRFLLIGDGIIQGIGALEVLVGLATPGTPHTVRTTARSSGPSIHVAPTTVGHSGYGVGALGTF